MAWIFLQEAIFERFNLFIDRIETFIANKEKNKDTKKENEYANE